MVEYIEKQKAIKLLDMCMVAAEKRWKEATNPLAKIEFKADKDTIEAMIEVVVSVPSADVQPVKRGKWIAENRDNRGYADCYTCTNCNCYTYTYTLMKDCEYDYCPNCGARMDLKDGEQNG